MIPLQPIALGLVVVALVVDGDGWDLLPDPIGWALVLLGTRALPVRRRGLLLATAAAALLVSAAVWPPGVVDRVAATDDSLSWALSLPQAAYAVLLSDGLRRAAADAGDRSRAAWFATTALLALVAALLPVPVLATGADSWGGIAVLAADLSLVLLVVLTLSSARQPWAGGYPRSVPGLVVPPPTGPTGGPDSDSGPKSAQSS